METRTDAVLLRKRRPSRWGTRRDLGIATVEALMFLPLLVAIFAGVQLVIRLNLAVMTARSHARSCAWRTATAGCGEVPEGCEGTPEDTPSGRSAKDRLDDSKAFEGVSGSESAEREVVAKLDGLLVERITLTATRSYRVPLPLVPKDSQQEEATQAGDGEDRDEVERSVEAAYRLPCNSRPSHADNPVKAFWEEFSP